MGGPNEQITDLRVRATVVPMNGQSDAFSQILNGPGVAHSG